MKMTIYQNLSGDDKRLVDAAHTALQHAFNPFNNRLIGAAVLAEDGTIIPGSSLLVTATGLNMCAERTAVSAAISLGHKHIKKLAVIGGEGFKNAIITPCGTCRQFIYGYGENNNGQIEILCVSPDKSNIMQTTINELLPFPYIVPVDH